MTLAPLCAGLGRHCRELAVTLSVGHLDDDDAPTRDAVGTWLLGHRERVSFREPYRRGRQVVVDAVVHVPCRYLEVTAGGVGPWEAVRNGARRERAVHRCRAHGFVGRVPFPRAATPRPLQHADGTLTLVHRGRSRRMRLNRRPEPPRALPVLQLANPCVGAPCRTADHTRGAACCRDLTLEIVAPADDPRSSHLEALLLARRSPYLCKTERVSQRIIECEVISACGYLQPDGITCVLHGRLRPDHRPAKPGLCTDWPDLGPDDVGHPGCALLAGKDGGRAQPEGGSLAARPGAVDAS